MLLEVASHQSEWFVEPSTHAGHRDGTSYSPMAPRVADTSILGSLVEHIDSDRLL